MTPVWAIREWTGAGTARIHANARLLVERGAQVQFRMPVLPGLNDDPAHLGRVAAFLAGLGVSELRAHGLEAAVDG